MSISMSVRAFWQPNVGKYSCRYICLVARFWPRVIFLFFEQSEIAVLGGYPIVVATLWNEFIIRYFS